MKDRIKAAFFDIDGTLVSFKTHVISEKSVESLERLRKNGVKVFISSGRHKMIMDNLKGFDFDGYICMNGALIFADGEVIYRRPLDLEDAVEVARIAHENGIPCAAFCESSIGISSTNDVTDATFRMIDVVSPPLMDLHAKASGGEVYQYTIFVNKEEEARLLAPVLRNTDSTRWHPEFTDLIPKNLSKADGIACVMEKYGFSREEVIAFGDGGNDVEMLDFAGIGVAMGNATDEVKAHADYVTSSVDEEGVTSALRHFGLI